VSRQSFFVALLLGLGVAAHMSCAVYSEDLLVEDDDGSSTSSSSSAQVGSGGSGGIGMGGAGAMGGGPASSSSGPGGAPTTSSSSSSSSSSSTGGGGVGVAWINELHYDNASIDVNEGVEIAGTAGLDLSNWTIELYNGSSSVSYDTVMLSGSIPNQAGNKGTVWFAIADVQNGAPDGVALIDAQSQVVQFLSYEGAFTAGDGPAMGSMSTDMGVLETNTDTVGLSLQLTGTGSSYAAFTWTGPVAATPDQPNAGQTLQ
jgi:uncharacterized protein